MKNYIGFSGHLLIAAAACLVLASCEHADPLDSGALEPTLASIQENIFDVSCALPGCHAGSNPQMGLDLTAGQSQANLVGVGSEEVPAFERVDPGNPDDSYLIMKIEGDSRIVGARMPLGRAPLPGEQIAVIREWILDGAQ
jgi:hypothetical protein